MKRFLYSIAIVLLSLLFVSSSQNKNEVVLKHTNYTSTFSISKKYPVMVEWWVTKAMVSCPTPLKRKDNFKPDPLLPQHTDIAKDYVGSGYDKGHVMPAADNLCQTQKIQDESFYFSNMMPQPHYSNAGPWKKIEIMTRELSLRYDSVRVWAGGIGSVKTFGENKVSVPSKTWKVIYIKKTKTFIAYIFPNSNEKITDVELLRVKKEDVEKLTDLKFN